MNGWRILLIGIITASLWAPGSAGGRTGYEYIDINQPFLRKMPLAVPLFTTVSGDAQETLHAQKAMELLTATLDFTGYFQIMDRGAFLYDPQKDGHTTASINFPNWTVIGAELLILGRYELRGDDIGVEFRLFDTVQGRRLIGKRYTGKASDQRRIILRFCSEVIYALTGNRGIFEHKIAFVSNGSGHKEIFTCEFDGYDPQQVTRNGTITLFPSWSSDGNWIAFTSYVKGKPDLYIRSLKDKRETVIARPGINISPAWVPGKFELAATLSYSGDPEIYLLTGSGKIIKRLTHNAGNDVSPSWAPDGQKMAFVSNRAGSPQIYIKDLESGTERRLTFEGNYNTQPSWSPRGDRIAYASMVDGNHNIFVIGADGEAPVQLTRDTGDNEAPSWSPDGSLIVFSSNREGPSRIYVMTAFGTDQRRLMEMKGDQTNPKWSY
ncbi:MAG: Tol-Pal system beta propeller repeat protein TolB [Desulfobacterales bacterium]|nr:MAG: Tol-Pal system beta propeller repeat protein TolB [Desulfobacterales bacterium]